MAHDSSERLRVAVPWNLSRYIPRNGFHQLYQPLFEGNSRVEFEAIDQVVFARKLERSLVFGRKLVAGSEKLSHAFRRQFAGFSLANDFLEHVTSEELWTMQQVPGDLEFHHTSPLTAQQRPFVLHCESFLPIFLPFLSQGRRGMERHAEIRAFYRALLASPLCLSIMSHMPGTLRQISNFFRDSEIDRKLFLSKIGLSQPNLEFLLSQRRRSEGEDPVFLFTSSSHQRAESFALRGGYVALRFAEQYLASGNKGQFIFRATRPSDDEMRARGMNPDALKVLESKQILWLEGYLSEHLVLQLFATSDVLLLPSVNLHSATLMQALAAGVIPVVSDTDGTEQYVKDGVTGLVLKGVRDRVWGDDVESRMRLDRHELFPELLDDLVEQLFQKLVPLLAKPAAIAALRAEMRRDAETRFSGTAFRDDITDQILRVASDYRACHGTPLTGDWSASSMQSSGIIRNEGWERYFRSPPVPVRTLDVGHVQIYSGMGVYYCIRGGKQDTLDQWSPLMLWLQGRLGAMGTQLVDSDLALEEQLFFAHASSMATNPHIGRIREGAKRALLRYPLAYRLAGIVFRFLIYRVLGTLTEVIFRRIHPH